MKDVFLPGSLKTYSHIVSEEDTARFDSGEVHQLYSTFALARDAEWTGRLFVLEMKEDGEEGIGTGLTIRHHSPALVGEEVKFQARLAQVSRNEVITDYTAHVGGRLIAEGRQWQKIVTKTRLERIFTELKS